jgi:ComF family protein
MSLNIRFLIHRAAMLFDLFLPHYCILCARRASHGEDATGIPLCGECAAALKPIKEPRCGRCGRELYSEQGICWDCRNSSHRCDSVYPLFRFKGDSAILIRTYKSSRRWSLAPFWADLMKRHLDARWSGWTVVPVPPRPEKLARREWDQVEALARCLEKGGIEVERLLVRGDGGQQKLLDRASRKLNATKAYSLDPARSGTVPERIVLIDDVYTTGATIDACSGVLFDAGASRVEALVLAAD